MKLYNTEKELTFSDYKPVKSLSLIKLPVDELRQLIDNMEKATENAWFHGNDLLALAIDTDIKQVETYARMKERKAAKEGQKQ